MSEQGYVENGQKEPGVCNSHVERAVRKLEKCQSIKVLGEKESCHLSSDLENANQ